MQDLARYEQFVTHVSGLLTPAVYAAVQQINARLEERPGFADVKVIVTGGKALQFFFGQAPELLTNDVDVKVTSGRAEDQERCAAVSKEFSALAAATARGYLQDMAIGGETARFQNADDGGILLFVAGFDDFALVLRDEGWVWHREGVVENVVFAYKNLQDNIVSTAPFVDSVFYTTGPTMANFVADAEFDAAPASIEDQLAYYAAGSSDPAIAYQSTLGRKGFYRQKLTYVDAGDRLYVAALGYVLHDMVMMLNKMYDYAQLVANSLGDPRAVGYMLNGGALVRGRRPPIKLKYQRYLAKYRRAVASLSDPKYLNHHTVRTVVENGRAVLERSFCAFGDGSSTREELLAALLSSRLLPDTDNVRAVLSTMNFDTLCDYSLNLAAERRS